MKSSIKKDTFRAIYRLLDKVSPINDDCGKLCGAACCTCADEATENTSQCQTDCNADFEMGIYLLPGEEKLFTGKENWLSWGWLQAEDYEFPESWSGRVYFLRCQCAPHCPREQRPLQCRFFPLTPHLDKDGELFLIYQSAALPYTCPLITERIPLNQDFIHATYTVWKHLIRDPLIFDLVDLDSICREDDGEAIEIVYPPLG